MCHIMLSVWHTWCRMHARLPAEVYQYVVMKAAQRKESLKRRNEDKKEMQEKEPLQISLYVFTCASAEVRYTRPYWRGGGRICKGGGDSQLISMQRCSLMATVVLFWLFYVFIHTASIFTACKLFITFVYSRKRERDRHRLIIEQIGR